MTFAPALRCDACRRPFLGGGATEDEMRQRAAQQGWKRLGAYDVCPQCSPDRVLLKKLGGGPFAIVALLALCACLQACHPAPAPTPTPPPAADCKAACAVARGCPGWEDDDGGETCAQKCEAQDQGPVKLDTACVASKAPGDCAAIDGC